MNLEVDGEIARVSKNPAHPCKKNIAVAQSPVDLIASLLPQRLMASVYFRNKKRFVRDPLISVVGAGGGEFYVMLEQKSSKLNGEVQPSALRFTSSKGSILCQR